MVTKYVPDEAQSVWESIVILLHISALSYLIPLAKVHLIFSWFFPFHFCWGEASIFEIETSTCLTHSCNQRTLYQIHVFIAITFFIHLTSFSFLFTMTICKFVNIYSMLKIFYMIISLNPNHHKKHKFILFIILLMYSSYSFHLYLNDIFSNQFTWLYFLSIQITFKPLQPWSGTYYTHSCLC